MGHHPEQQDSETKFQLEVYTEEYPAPNVWDRPRASGAISTNRDDERREWISWEDATDGYPDRLPTTRKVTSKTSEPVFGKRHEIEAAIAPQASGNPELKAHFSGKCWTEEELILL